MTLDVKCATVVLLCFSLVNGIDVALFLEPLGVVCEALDTDCTSTVVRVSTLVVVWGVVEAVDVGSG